eukprot:12906506-Prorocentrum_lima.AAC.1
MDTADEKEAKGPDNIQPSKQDGWKKTHWSISPRTTQGMQSHTLAPSTPDKRESLMDNDAAKKDARDGDNNTTLKENAT